MNFLGDLWNSIFGKKKDNQAVPQPAPARAPISVQPAQASQPRPATPINSLNNRETNPPPTLNVPTVGNNLQKAPTQQPGFLDQVAGAAKSALYGFDSGARQIASDVTGLFGRQDVQNRLQKQVNAERQVINSSPVNRVAANVGSLGFAPSTATDTLHGLGTGIQAAGNATGDIIRNNPTLNEAANQAVLSPIGRNVITPALTGFATPTLQRTGLRKVADTQGQAVDKNSQINVFGGNPVKFVSSLAGDPLSYVNPEGGLLSTTAKLGGVGALQGAFEPAQNTGQFIQNVAGGAAGGAVTGGVLHALTNPGETIRLAKAANDVINRLGPGAKTFEQHINEAAMALDQVPGLRGQSAQKLAEITQKGNVPGATTDLRDLASQMQLSPATRNMNYSELKSYLRDVLRGTTNTTEATQSKILAPFGPTGGFASTDLLTGGLASKMRDAQQAATEVAPGVHSVNPNKEADAAQQVADQAAQTIQNVTPEAGAPPSAPVDAPSVQAVPTTPDLASQPPQPSAPVQPPLPSDAPSAPPPQSPPQSPPPDIPALPDNPSAAQVPVAPQTHDALVKSLPSAFDSLKGNYNFRDAMHIQEAKDAAARAISNISDANLIQSFSTADPATMVRDARSFSVARAALERLSQHPEDPAAVQTVTNIMNALESQTSKSGQVLRMAQEEFDNMPLPMKVRYVAKKIDAANINTKNYVPLSEDPAKASIVEQELTYQLNKSQKIADLAAQVEDKLVKVAEDAKNGIPTTENVGSLKRQLNDVKRQLQAQNGEIVKYYSTLVPGRTGAQKALSDFPRTMMLASFTGRLNDIATTAANVGHLSAQNIVQGIISKGVNLVRPGTVTDTTKGFSQLVTGGLEGAKKTAGEIAGNQYVPDLQKGIANNIELRSGLTKSKGAFGRTVQAATEAATNLSEGVKTQRLYQLADQEAAKLGLKGDLRSQYVQARSAVPSRQMLDMADQLHKEVNNLNDNPITHTLNRVASSIQGDSAVGGLIKNQILPFTSWAGGSLYNTITDKNVVANAVKIAAAAKNGDAEGIVRNLAKLATNAAETYAAGYLLTQMGIITNQDAQGYNDYGAYLHIGDRYIPVGFLGFFAPNMVIGNAVYNGLNNNNGQNPAAKIAEDLGSNLTKSSGVMTALGVDNNLTRSISEMTKPGGSFLNAVASFGTGAVGQFIPGLAGDVNAVLNNGIPGVPGSDALNPTHEAAQTKVANPNSPSGTAKDVIASQVASLENRIPILSQTLPRQSGVASSDLIDRVTKGNQDTATTITKRQQAADAAKSEADFAARDIPDYRNKKVNFANAVETKVENGQYDKAIEGLQAKLNNDMKDKNIPKSKLQGQKDEITKLQVAKDGKFGPNVIQLYKDTSVSEWRDMGDPTSDNYNPGVYQTLWEYDNALANKGVSRNNTRADRPFYSAKAPTKRRTGTRSAANGNTIGSPPSIGRISLGNLSSKSTNTAPVPVLAKLKTSELVKKHKISVSRS